MSDLRVLVVDDHPIVRKGLTDLLTDEPGLVVVGEASSIAQALTISATQKPDVAIVDLILGDEDGLELVAALAQSRPTTHVLVLSSHDEWLYADRALKAGAKGYLMKDTPAAVLIDSVRRVGLGKVCVSAAAAERILETLGRPSAASARSPLDRLSDRERHVFTLLGRGRSTREIAQQLDLSVKTVETHCAHLKEKLGARNGRELVRLAIGWAQEH